jgi:hypothetical protein
LETIVDRSTQSYVGDFLGQDHTGAFFEAPQGPKQLMSSLFQIACGTQNFLMPIRNPGIHQRLIKAQERWMLGPLV